MGKIMGSCNSAAFLASKKIDYGLTIGEELKLKIHNMNCKYCKIYEQQINLLNSTLQKINGSIYENAQLKPDDRLIIKQKMDEELDKIEKK
mgnify:CR=1 FL=1